MLLDIDFLIGSINQMLAQDPLSAIVYPGGIGVHQPGVYNGGFNLGNVLEQLRNGHGALFKVVRYPIGDAQDAEDKGLSREHWREDYVVADSVEQLLDYWRPEVDHPDVTYIIGATVVERDQSNAGKRGGWRWHKWGEYIGTQEPTMEHLDDEPLIERITVGHIYRVARADGLLYDARPIDPTTGLPDPGPGDIPTPPWAG